MNAQDKKKLMWQMRSLDLADALRRSLGRPNTVSRRIATKVETNAVSDDIRRMAAEIRRENITD